MNRRGAMDTEKRNGTEPLRSSQSKRKESLILSKMFSPAVFSALIASLRFKWRSHFVCGFAALRSSRLWG